MLAAASYPILDPAPRLQRTEGEARLTTQLLDGSTRLATLYQAGAAKIRLPHTHDESLQAVLMNTAGGLTGGDRLRWQVELAPDTCVVLTTPASERIYRSLGSDAHIETHLSVGPGARLDWLPQETILFEGARLSRRIEVDLAPDSRFLAVEAVLLGRQAMGEAAYGARLSDDWRVRRTGRLIHAEASRLTADRLERDAISLLAGASAFATILYVGADAAARRDAIGDCLEQCDIGASVIGEKLVVRALATSGIALRRMIVPIIAVLSGAGALPRLWTL